MRAFLPGRISEMRSYDVGGSPEVWLVEVYADSSTVYRYTSHDQDVVFGGQTWTSHAMDVRVPDSDAQGTEQDWSVTLGDSDLTHHVRLAAGKYLDQRIAAFAINLATKATATDRLTYRGLIVGYNCAEQSIGDAVTFVCSSYQMRDHVLPAETLERDRCNNVFEDDLGRCGHTGGGTCRKTWDDCVLLSNSTRFRAGRGMLRVRP